MLGKLTYMLGDEILAEYDITAAAPIGQFPSLAYWGSDPAALLLLNSLKFSASA